MAMQCGLLVRLGKVSNFRTVRNGLLEPSFLGKPG